MKEFLCEVCGKKMASALSYIPSEVSNGWLGGRWKWVCGCSVDTELYYLDAEDVLNRLDEILNHLAEKRWFDKRRFLQAIERYPSKIQPNA